MEHVGFLPQTVLLLSAAVFVVVIFKRLNLSPVLGYLFAGAAIGEHGFGYVDSSHLHVFAELGVVFLLFAIGIELTFERLMSMRMHVFGFGTAQVLLTSLAISAITLLFGLNIETAIIIGGGLSLSSTAVVLRVLNDNNAHTTQVGRLALANLLLQDFAVVPLLVIVPLLSKADGDLAMALGSAMGKGALALVAIFFFGRMLLRPLFNLIASAKSNELFVAATLLVVLGSSLATQYLELSLAMGAFIAGLLVAETKYQHQVEDNIMPFKDLLMGLFFMAVGMTISLENIYNHWFLIISISIALIVVKALIITVLSKIFGFPWRSSIHAGLLLCQGSEFAFILFGLASQTDIGIISPENAQVLLLVVTITMAVTPALSVLGNFIGMRVDPGRRDLEDTGSGDLADISRHVVICGFGKTGSMVAKLLDAQKIQYVAIDADIKRVKLARKRGLPVYHGDPSKVDILNTVNIDRAKAAIVTISDNVYLKKTIHTINRNFPEVPIVVRAEDLRNAKTLEKLGATIIVPEKYESGLQLAGELLRAVGMSEFEISKLKNQFRASNYEYAKEIAPNTEA